MESRDSAPPPSERATDALSTCDARDAGPAAPARVTEALPAEEGEKPLAGEGDVLLGKYRVEGVIGRGGMGVVVAARHLRLGTRVAIKLVRPGKERRGLAAARLLREARSAARLAGDHVVRVIDVEALETGEPCIVMEHLEGRDLAAELAARGPLPIDEAVAYVLQACEAVAEAHAAGIVHRDLKPSNLFLTTREGAPLVKVLDFGIAKALDGEGDDGALTASYAVLGSPVYMSPEQIRSARKVDRRSDVWSLGVILHELVTARLPFEGSSASAQLAAIAADSPIPLRKFRPDAPAALEAVILRCLEKDVDARIPDVAALTRALAPFSSAAAVGSIARVEPALDTASPRPARPRRTRAIALAAALLVGAAGSYGAWVAKRSPRGATESGAAQPPSAEAARLRAEGLAKLRGGDAQGAKVSLEAAIAADPAYALAHAAMSEVWSALGRDAESKAAATRAFELSVGLPREERLLVEGRYRAAMRSWEEAISIHRGLYGFFPDNLDYGLALADAERMGGKGKDALATVEALRKLPPPAGGDPRIDLAEAMAAESITDMKRAQAAAGQALQKAEAAGARYLAGVARMPLAYACLRLGDAEKAGVLYEEARAIFTTAGDRAAEARALSNLAMVRAEQGNAAASKKLLEEALSIQRALGNQAQVATVLNNLGNLADDQGEPAAARRLFEEALATFRAIGDARGVLTTLGNIGATLSREGDLAAARAKLEEALGVARKLGADADIALMTSNVAAVSLDQGDLAGAKEMFQEVLPWCRKMEDKECTANALSGLGSVLAHQDDLAASTKRYEEALAIREQAGSKGPQAELRLRLADLALAAGDAVKAEALAREAEAAFHESQQVEEANARAMLVIALLAQGKRKEGLAAAERAKELLEGEKAPAARVPLVLATARARVASGQAALVAAALRDAEAAVGEAQKTSAGMALEARLTLGELEAAAGRPSAAARLAAVEREAKKQGFLRFARRAARR